MPVIPERATSSSTSPSTSSSSSSESRSSDDDELFAAVTRALNTLAPAAATGRHASRRRHRHEDPHAAVALRSALIRRDDGGGGHSASDGQNNGMMGSPLPANPSAAAGAQAPTAEPVRIAEEETHAPSYVPRNQHPEPFSNSGDDDAAYGRGGFLTHSEIRRRKMARLAAVEAEAHANLTYRPAIYRGRIKSQLIVARPSKVEPQAQNVHNTASTTNRAPPSWADRLYHESILERAQRLEAYEAQRLDAERRDAMLAEVHCTFAPTTNDASAFSIEKRDAAAACAALYRAALREQHRHSAQPTTREENASNAMQRPPIMNAAQQRLFNDAMKRQGGKLEALKARRTASQATHRRAVVDPPPARRSKDDTHYYIM